jgi:hypothetical protein
MRAGTPTSLVKCFKNITIRLYLWAIKVEKIGDLEILTIPPIEKDIHTLTLYLNPSRQEAYFSYILALHPMRIIFNPGTENVALRQLANEHGIETIEACTLVMLRTGQF